MDLQNVLAAHPELFPGGEKWELVPGRHTAGGGVLDLLCKIGRLAAATAWAR
jgi:hypothetical protein